MHLRNPRQQLIGLRRIWKVSPIARSAAMRNARYFTPGLTDRAFFCAPGQWTVYRCTECGSGYLDPRPTPASISQAYVNYCTHFKKEFATLKPIERIARALANGYRNYRFAD